MSYTRYSYTCMCMLDSKSASPTMTSTDVRTMPTSGQFHRLPTLPPPPPPARANVQPIRVEQTLSATNCSSDTLLLTEEEASSSGGKVFSCSCGGGEDAWTDVLCGLQPDTWIQWAVMGRGTEGNELASITIKGVSNILSLFP